MKALKYLLVFSLCAVLLLAAGCGGRKNDEPSSAQGKTTVISTAQSEATTEKKPSEKLNPFFTARVIEVNDSAILVEPFEGEKELKSADRISVSLNVISTIEVPPLEAGSVVRIIYNGEIAESYPAQINTVFAIYLCDANGSLVDKGM